MDKLQNIIDNIGESFLTMQSGQIYRRFIGNAERILIEKILERCDGNQISASKILGLNRNTLRAKIKKLNINLEKYRT